MKKQILISSLLLSGLVLVGCDRTAPEAASKTTTDKSSISETTTPSNTVAELPAVWAKPYKMDVVNKKICSLASQEDNAGCTIYDIQSIKTNLDWINQYYDNELKKQYQEAFAAKNEVTLPDSEDNYEYYVGSMVRFKGQLYNLVTFSQFDNSYSGGAHNHYNVTYATFDLKTKKKLGLNDIIQANAKDRILALIKKYNASELKEYGTDLTELQVSDNFYLAENGLMLVYSPYEIAPWVFGMPELFVPYDELKDLIKSEYLPEQPDTTLSREFS